MLEASEDRSRGARIGLLRIAPRDLVRLLEGFPSREGDEKVTRSWSLKLGKDVFDVYDWKMTSYSAPREEGYPTPKVFWAGTDPVEFTVAGMPWADTSALAKAFTVLAEERGVANVSLTRYP